MYKSDKLWDVRLDGSSCPPGIIEGQSQDWLPGKVDPGSIPTWVESYLRRLKRELILPRLGFSVEIKFNDWLAGNRITVRVGWLTCLR